MQNKNLLGLLITAAAVYTYYRISKMTAEEKNSLKEKGKKFVNENFGLGNIFPTKDMESAGS